MSGIEILGIVAAALQIAELGSRLSVKLYTHHHKLKNADKSIQGLSRDVALTCNVMRQLGDSLKEDTEARLYSPEAFSTAQEVMDECRGVFTEIEIAITPSSASGNGTDSSVGSGVKAGMFARVTQKFTDVKRDSYLTVLGSNLERLKSTMLLMLNVIIYAGQMEHKALDEQRDLVKALLAEKAASEQRLDALILAKTPEPGRVQESELHQYTSLMRTLLQEISSVKLHLNSARHDRVRKGVEKIHLSETMFLLEQYTVTELGQSFSDSFFAFDKYGYGRPSSEDANSSKPDDTMKRSKGSSKRFKSFSYRPPRGKALPLQGTFPPEAGLPTYADPPRSKGEEVQPADSAETNRLHARFQKDPPPPGPPRAYLLPDCTQQQGKDGSGNELFAVLPQATIDKTPSDSAASRTDLIDSTEHTKEGAVDKLDEDSQINPARNAVEDAAPGGHEPEPVDVLEGYLLRWTILSAEEIKT
ncbi:hypothetical protein BJY04DRAFT_218072 [Aspergillus karnatakaensis]|uniref:uncharacterized protein n=1 Tax=Aspergillus karnatakaensis TaxID=1810916 RepID=UPI003CCCC4BB